MDTTFYILLFGSYLLGSISSAVLVCRLLGLGDPRHKGSKNPGTTNVLRLGGKGAALLTLAGDVAKGAIPVVVGILVQLPHSLLGWLALAAFLGHLYPVFFGFAGGKGVATAIGALLALNPALGGTLIMIWIGVAFTTGYSSLAALIAAFLAPTVAYLMSESNWSLCILMSLILIWRHRNNIKNLMNGTESKIRITKKS